MEGAIVTLPADYARSSPRAAGTLAGDLLWLGTIGFILAIITGMIA